MLEQVKLHTSHFTNILPYFIFQVYTQSVEYSAGMLTKALYWLLSMIVIVYSMYWCYPSAILFCL
jgi:hypothetical protein